jgi:hypothetical protein
MTISPYILVNNGTPRTLSNVICAQFDVAHDLLVNTLKSLKISETLKAEHFVPCFYSNEKNEKKALYRISKDGIVFLESILKNKLLFNAYLDKFASLEASINFSGLLKNKQASSWSRFFNKKAIIPTETYPIGRITFTG